MKSLRTLCAAAALALVSGHAGAGTVHLDTSTSGLLQGALFTRANPTNGFGSGAVNSFLRLQSPSNSTTEQGFNTDGALLQDQLGGHSFNHSLLVSGLPALSIGGTTYYQLIIDASEPQNGSGSPASSIVTLTELQIFLGDSASLTSLTDETGFVGHSSLVYSLDQGVDGDSSVVIDTSINGSGNGKPDAYAFIPKSFFAGPNPYVYVYAKFTDATGSFEEFVSVGSPVCPASRTDCTPVPPNEVPEPASLALLGMGLAGLALRKKK